MGEQQRKKRVVVLGSTGSVGRSALDVMQAYPAHFEVVGLVAHQQVELLAEQAALFNPTYLGVTGRQDAQVAERLKPLCKELLIGPDAASIIAGASPGCDVLAAIVGVAGLKPVDVALQAGCRVLLANKESLVCAGKYIGELIATGASELIPVDSEHSAIAQLLVGRQRSQIVDYTLTASGGPFRTLPQEQFDLVTVEQALKHPTWSMGKKISIDSATMMNKALEVIEAHWLFNVPPEKIQVVVHPQSIVHGLISLSDGTSLAHLSAPDMKGAIAYALTGENSRLSGVMEPLNLAQVGSLTFHQLDDDKFPAVSLAKEACRLGGAAPAVMNSANEVAVELFLRGKIPFSRIVPLVEVALQQFGGRQYSSITEILALHNEVISWVEGNLSKALDSGR